MVDPCHYDKKLMNNEKYKPLSEISDLAVAQMDTPQSTIPDKRFNRDSGVKYFRLCLNIICIQRQVQVNSFIVQEKYIFSGKK